MSGLKLFWISLIALALGIVISTNLLFTAPPQLLIFVYIVMFIAGLLIAWSAAKFVNHLVYSHRQAVQERWGQTGLAAFEAMIYMSVADGQLQEEEISLISSISQRLFGSPASEQEIRTAAAQALRKNIPIERIFEGLDRRLTLEQRGMVIKAAFYVLKADGYAHEGERALFSRMVAAMNYPTDALVKITSDFLEE